MYQLHSNQLNTVIIINLIKIKPVAAENCRRELNGGTTKSKGNKYSIAHDIREIATY